MHQKSILPSVNPPMHPSLESCSAYPVLHPYLFLHPSSHPSPFILPLMSSHPSTPLAFYPSIHSSVLLHAPIIVHPSATIPLSPPHTAPPHVHPIISAHTTHSMTGTFPVLLPQAGPSSIPDLVQGLLMEQMTAVPCPGSEPGSR